MVCHQEHRFYASKAQAQRRVLVVFLLTLLTMLIEVIAGYLYNSVAVLADGIHMFTHAFAFAITYMAYFFAKRWAGDSSFTFGTWKVEVLGAYTSSILLFFLSFLILQEAFLKFFNRGHTKYEEAMFVAFLGLAVNLVSAYVLHGSHHHDQTDHEHEHHHDLNLKSAYLHVLADALTSVLAIGGLLAGKHLGLWFLDPLMGVFGFVLILRWSVNLMKESASVLLDREGKNPLLTEIINKVESDGTSKVYDLHLLKVYNNKYACIIGLETHGEKGLEHYQNLLSSFEEIAHVTIELRRCL